MSALRCFSVVNAVLINVNNATFEELRRLPRVGIRIAVQIMNLRNIKKFASVDDLVGRTALGRAWKRRYGSLVTF